MAIPLTDQSQGIKSTENYIRKQRKKGKKRQTAFIIGDRRATVGEERRILRAMKAQQKEYERRKKNQERSNAFDMRRFSRYRGQGISIFLS